MNWLYLALDLGSIFIPFVFSFHPKLKFYRKWRALSIALLGTMLVFIPWDIWFTVQGYWGFNPTYLTGASFLHLPVEEWLFFICIPYACVFTHYALIALSPGWKLNSPTVKGISIALLAAMLLLVIVYFDRWYTLVNYSYGIILLSLVYVTRPSILQHYYLTFLVMLIPFFIVNGILTGSLIPDEVVWYNNMENLNIRMGTIPAEDTIYAFTMILTNIYILERIHPAGTSSAE